MGVSEQPVTVGAQRVILDLAVGQQATNRRTQGNRQRTHHQWLILEQIGRHPPALPQRILRGDTRLMCSAAGRQYAGLGLI